MYNRRVKVFVLFASLAVAVCLFRMVQMQILCLSAYEGKVEQLQRNSSRMVYTTRGDIVDRRGRVLATDEAEFYVCADYSLTSALDERVDFGQYREQKVEIVEEVLGECAGFGVDSSALRRRMRQINDFIWGRRAFHAWRNKFRGSEVFNRYDSVVSIPLSVALEDLRKRIPNAERRRKFINDADISEMYESRPLFRLSSREDLLSAQLAFMDVNGVEILPQGKRVYPYGSVAAQTIGWIGPATEPYKLSGLGELEEYLPGEVCGRTHVEYVCEPVLRGRRGKVIYNYDSELLRREERILGRDVRLTIDIELQQQLERYLRDFREDSNHSGGMAAVVIEVEEGEVLALASIPTFDLNRARYEYDTLLNDAERPLINRTLNSHYPPGSAIKPMILVAGLETDNITVNEVISCPARPAPRGWPNCWIYNRYPGVCHDDMWTNTARNAIKGSCNIYFSRLADRIDSRELQRWLFSFGYGRAVSLTEGFEALSDFGRRLRQASGIIESGIPGARVGSFEDVGRLLNRERRWFGIGQGNLRVTVIQVANAMATVCRGGIYTPARLIWNVESQGKGKDRPDKQWRDLHISRETLKVVREGMHAVVNERGGTAYKAFADAEFTINGVKVYGKTGSTESPDNAWFAGFAEDNSGRAVALAVVVEGGQHGSTDAAPAGRQILELCLDLDYLGTALRGRD